MSEFPIPVFNTGIVVHHTASESNGDHIEMAETYGTLARDVFGACFYKILNPSTTVTQKLIEIGLVPICRPYNQIEHQHGALPWDADLYRTSNFLAGGGKLVESDDNEWNLTGEYGGWPDPRNIADKWVAFARWVLGRGGCPGTPATAQGGSMNDLHDALPRFIQRVNEIDPDLWRQPGIWANIHQYSLNHPPELEQDQCYFLGHRLYHQLFLDLTGVDLPMYATEGGPPPVGNQDDNRYPRITPELIRDFAVWMKAYVPERYLRGRGAYWLIANDGGDPVWYPMSYYEYRKPRGDHELAIAALAATPPGMHPGYSEGGPLPMGVTIDFTDPLIVANADLFRAWVAAGGVTNNFTTYLIGQDRLPLTPDLLKLTVNEAFAKADEAKRAINRYPF